MRTLILQRDLGCRRGPLERFNGVNRCCMRQRHRSCRAIPEIVQPVDVVDVALKEWAVTVAALGDGVQTVCKQQEQHVWCLV